MRAPSTSLLVMWNVWSNYIDTLLGSEILRLQNNEQKVFDKLYLYSQGGFTAPPTVEETTYLDGHLNIDIDSNHPFIQKDIKFRGVFRVLNGIKQAFLLGQKLGVDYVLVSNADAWVLSPQKLLELFLTEQVKKCAVSVRVGAMTALQMNYGEFAPMYDDHFIILNVKRCTELNIFAYHTPKAYSSIFYKFGGFHYILGALLDEIVPEGELNIYTWLNDCYNHFGEKSGMAILPWQYQEKFDFLHANCMHDSFLDPLRATFLKHRGFERFSFCKKYIEQYKKPPFDFKIKNGVVAYRRPWRTWLLTRLLFFKNEMLRFLVKAHFRSQFIKRFGKIHGQKLAAQKFDFYESLFKNTYSIALTLYLTPPKYPHFADRQHSSSTTKLKFV